LTAVGIYLVLRMRTFPVILGLTFLSYAVNVFLFTSGRLVAVNRAPIIGTNDLRRPVAAGAGADRHRDFLRDDGGHHDHGHRRLSGSRA
jgi:hypothetical protein